MSDEFIIDRIRKNEKFRRLEEERRKRLLEACTTTTDEDKDETTLPYNRDILRSVPAVATNVVSASVTKQPAEVPSLSAKKLSLSKLSGRMDPTSTKGVSFLQQPNQFPKSVGYLHMKSSPSSSVTMSQTPEKNVYVLQGNNRRKKITTLLDSDDSSSDGEDLLELAKQLNREKQQRIGQQTAAQNTKSFTETTTKTKRKLSVLDSESEGEDDLVSIARKIDEKRNESVLKSLSCTSPNSSGNSHKVKKAPRNPLTLMKEEMALDAGYINNNNITKGRSASSRNLFLETKHGLWSDSEDEKVSGPSLTRTTSSLKSKEKRHKSDGSTIMASDVQTLEKVDYDGDNDDDKDSRQRQKPQFDQPKFGPYDPPVPFILRSNNDNNNNNDDDSSYEVPASINRYLPNYQREGIEFMYKCGIATNVGAILGDGTLCKLFSLF
jgi:hypothetical protein